MKEKPKYIHFEAPGRKAIVYGEGEIHTPLKKGWQSRENRAGELMEFFKSRPDTFQQQQRKLRKRYQDN